VLHLFARCCSLSCVRLGKLGAGLIIFGSFLTLGIHWAAASELGSRMDGTRAETSKAPTPTAATQMSVFHNAASLASAPSAARRVFTFQASHGFGRPLFNKVHLLIQNGGWNLYAVPTTRGFACFAVVNGVGAWGGCTSRFAAATPLLPRVGQSGPGQAVVVAGLASNSVRSVRAQISEQNSCSAAAKHNGFFCLAKPTSNGLPRRVHFHVWLRNGSSVDFSR
jgi:hypothetical protein